MLKEVTCSCFWGEGIRVVRLKEKVREASCMYACRIFFLLTSLAFPYIIQESLQYQSLNSQFTVVDMEEEKKKSQQWLTSFFIYCTKSKRMQSCLKVCLIFGCPVGLSSSSSVLIGFQTYCLLEPLPFVSVCLHHLRACLTSCCMSRVIWAQIFQACLCNQSPVLVKAFVSFCICSANHFVRHLSTNVSILVFVYAAKSSPLQTFQFGRYEDIVCEPEVFMIRKRKHLCSSLQPS